jgi:hypothetical protein
MTRFKQQFRKNDFATGKAVSARKLIAKVSVEKSKKSKSKEPPSNVSVEYAATILKKQYMRLIRKHLKTCEIKGRKLTIRVVCRCLVLKMNKEGRDGGLDYYMIANLIDHIPIGPYKTGAQVLAAAETGGFKTGMDEAELDAFIAEQSSKEVWVHRFNSATVTDAVKWDNRPGNNNCGYLYSYNETSRRVRFSVADGSTEFPVLSETGEPDYSDNEH